MADPIVETRPPTEVLDYLRQRGRRQTVGWSHQDVWGEEHAAQWTVAKVTQADVLSAMYNAFEASVARGETFESFRKRLQPEMERLGWWGKVDSVDPVTGRRATVDFSDPSRLKKVYGTNMRTSYGAGQWQRIERTKRGLPYLLYGIGPSNEHRPEHVAWNGTLLLVDDPWWHTHFCPNGYECKCNIRAVSQREYDRLKREGVSSPGVQEIGEDGLPTGHLVRTKIPVQTTAPTIRYRTYTNTRTGEVRQIPDGIDPGFGTNPGRMSRLDQAARIWMAKLPTFPAAIGAELSTAVADYVTPRLAAEVAVFVRDLAANKLAVGAVQVAGSLPRSVVDFAAKKGFEPASAAVVLTRSSLVPKEFTDLAGGLKSPDAILWDPDGPSLVFVFKTGRDRRAAIRIRPQEKGEALTVNRITSVQQIRVEELRSFELIEGDL